jgi:hypothetical protein
MEYRAGLHISIWGLMSRLVSTPVTGRSPWPVVTMASSEEIEAKSTDSSL